MTTTDVRSMIPVGWYPDPAGSEQLRWWNGERWTAELQDAVPVVPVAPVTPIVPAFTLPQEKAQTYRPFQSAPRTDIRMPRSIVYTRAVWWLAFSPIWTLAPQAVVIGFIVTLLGAGNPVLYSWPVAGVNLAVYLVLVLMAASDRRALLAGGNGSAASVWWMALSPLIYLIARSIHVARWERAAWAPLIWWVVASFAAPVLAVVGYFAVLGIIG